MRKFTRVMVLFTAILLCFSMVACSILDLQGSQAVKLSKPTNVKVSGATLSWNFVENAIGYTVKIVEGENADIETAEGSEIPVSETSYSLESLSDGKYTVGVKARGDSVVYSSSDYASVQYTRTKDTGAQYGDHITGAFGSFDEINTRESYLGYGIDIINSTGVTSKNIKLTYPIFAKDAILNETLLKSNEHYSNLETIEASSIEEFKTKLASSSSISAGMSVSASANIYGVQVGAGMSFSNGYKQAFEQTSSGTYSQYFLEIIAENQNYWLMLQTSEARYRELLSDEFEKDLYDSTITPAELFDKYGTHLITSVAMGGNISMFYTLYSVEEGVTADQYYEVSSALKMNADVAYGSASAGTSADMETHNSQAYESLANSYGIRVEKKIVVSGGSGAFGISNESSLVNNYADWQKSLDAYPVVVGIKDSNSLYPIWNLIDRSTAEGAARYNELYNYFANYGKESYDSLCDTFGIKPPVAPEAIENVVVKTNADYQDGDVIQIKGGDSFRITFDVKPDNANKYKKTFASSSEFVSVDESGNVTVSEEIDHGAIVTITITAGTIQREIKLEAIKSYNVSFNTGVAGMSVDSIPGVLSGTYLDAPVLEREGYTLEGWYRDAERKLPFNFEVDTVISDLVLYAKWVAVKPVVSFNTMGGAEVAPETVKYGGTVTKPATPVWAGYTFAGWYTDAECTEEFNFESGVTKNITLYAKWTVKNYSVTFVANGGTEVAAQSTNVVKGYKITEPASERTYYVLAGWYKDEALTEEFLFTEKVTSDITLYAKWELKEIDVSFLAHNDEVITVVTTNKDKGFLIDVPSAPEREGYVFLGWSFEKNGELAELGAYKFSDENGGYKLYSNWVDEAHAYPFTLTVNYVHADGSVASPAYVSELYCDQTYSVASPYIEGYRPSESVIEGTMTAENITLTVTYSPAPYTVYVTYYIISGDDVLTDSVELYNYAYGEDYEITVPKKVGYKSDVDRVSGTMGASDAQHSVTYRPVSYTVVYDSNGGRGDMSPMTMVYGVSDYLSEIAFERDGYILDSWNTESDGSGAKYSARAYVKNLAADSGAVVTLYAIWTPVAYDVTFNTDPYSSGVDNQAKVLTEITFGGTTTTIVYDTSYTLPVPSADYYTFAGWYTAAGVQLTDGSGVGISPWNVPSDVTVLAKWEKSYAGYTYITTADEFRAIADNLSGKYLLLNDIYLGADWTPMGSYYWEHSNTDNIIAAPFSGVLDGQGHTITYAAVIPASVTAHIDYVYGLFGACDGAKFYGVKLNCSVTSASNPNPNCRECSMGGFAGIAKNTLFENCEILSGSSVLNEHTDETYYAYANMQYTGATYAGGFVGDARSCTFKNCKNAATVSAIGYVAYSGGLAGNAYECTFDDACANTGSITSSHASWVWGIHASGDLCAKTNEPWLRPNGNAIHRP